MAYLLEIIAALYVSGVVLNYIWLPAVFPLSMGTHNLRRVITAMLWPALMAYALLR